MFCGFTARFVWDLVGPPEDRLSRDAAQLSKDPLSFIYTSKDDISVDHKIYVWFE